MLVLSYSIPVWADAPVYALTAVPTVQVPELSQAGPGSEEGDRGE